MAIIVGDSIVKGSKIPTTSMTQKFCWDAEFEIQKIISNPLLGLVTEPYERKLLLSVKSRYK